MKPEISKRLREPIPGQLIKQLQGNDYISGQTAIDRLIQATDNEWSFHITNVISNAGHVAMQGELTIDGTTRSAWGEAKSTGNAKEELYKNAETDTLKRCARLFGVALELYGDLLDEETGEVTHRASQPRQHAPQGQQRPHGGKYAAAAANAQQGAPQASTAPRTPDVDDPTQPALSSQVSRLFELGREMDIYVKKYVKDQFGGREVNSLTYAEAEMLIEDWQTEIAKRAMPV